MDEMNEVVYVNTGEVISGSCNDVLKSTPIGSCIVAIAWHTKTRYGAMAHIMLPGKAPPNESQPTRYMENAIDVLAIKMLPAASLNETGICLIGAANVLKKEDDAICSCNIRSITDYLDQKGIPIHATALGGQQRRIACLYVSRGRIGYTQADAPEKTLWQYPDEQNHYQVLERISKHDRHAG